MCASMQTCQKVQFRETGHHCLQAHACLQVTTACSYVKEHKRQGRYLSHITALAHWVAPAGATARVCPRCGSDAAAAGGLQQAAPGDSDAALKGKPRDHGNAARCLQEDAAAAAHRAKVRRRPGPPRSQQSPMSRAAAKATAGAGSSGSARRPPPPPSSPPAAQKKRPRAPAAAGPPGDSGGRSSPGRPAHRSSRSEPPAAKLRSAAASRAPGSCSRAA